MQKPRLSFWQIWNMSFGFLGIQFGWGLQMANMSPIYKYLGAREDSQIPIFWLAAPLTGFIVQPIIGAMSDRTWGPLGRRRPYFLVGAILSSLALVADAELQHVVDGRRAALDSRCFDQYFDGTISRVRRGQIAGGTARHGFRDAELCYRRRRSDCRHAAVDVEELVSREQ